MSMAWSETLLEHIITAAGAVTTDPNIIYLERSIENETHMYCDMRHTSSENVRTDNEVRQKRKKDTDA